MRDIINKRVKHTFHISCVEKIGWEDKYFIVELSNHNFVIKREQTNSEGRVDARYLSSIFKEDGSVSHRWLRDINPRIEFETHDSRSSSVVGPYPTQFLSRKDLRDHLSEYLGVLNSNYLVQLNETPAFKDET